MANLKRSWLVTHRDIQIFLTVQVAFKFKVYINEFSQLNGRDWLSSLVTELPTERSRVM